MSEYLDSIADSLKEQGKQAKARARQDEEQAQLAEDYLKVDRAVLAKMPDKELAEWQGRYPPGSAQFILAEHEWQTRLTVRAIKAQFSIAFIGIGSAALGAVIGAVLTTYLPHLLADSPSMKPEDHASIYKSPCDDAAHATDDAIKLKAVPGGATTLHQVPVVNQKH